MTKWRSGPEKHMRFMGNEEIIQKSCAQSSANVSSVICAGECGFLQKYEQPKDIVDRYDSPRTEVNWRQGAEKVPGFYPNRFSAVRVNHLSLHALPACIVFIVFSSSLLDVIRGKISPAFIAGLGLIILVSLIPLFYRRYKTKKGMTDPL